jgi:protein Tob/BTG
MKKEIDVALDLLVSYVQHFGSIKEESIEEFRTKLQQNLLERYQGHWYPDKPIKGQAYRSLEFNKENDYSDVIVSQICNDSGFAPNLLGIRHDLTLWIDPYEVTIRLGNHASPKENQQLIVARFDKEGNELVRNDLDTLFSQSRIPMATPSTLRSSPTNSSSCDSASCSGSSTPQRTSSPHPTGQTGLVIPPTTMYHNGPLFTPPRALSPQAPTFQMSPSAPIKVPVKKYEQNHFLQNNPESISCEGSPIDGNLIQPDRSDTPHSMHSTTSNESSDSGYCGYVESFPYYYKLNRLYKALAIQKLSHPMGKVTHHSPATNNHHHQRRLPAHHQYQQQQQNNNTNIIPSSSPSLSSSPPTPTPMNINQFSPFYTQQSSYLPMPTTVTDSRKSKY